jgi:non-ribosomal peptide synthetase component F/thioesterase domain-containing protein/acyl carrier protein
VTALDLVRDLVLDDWHFWLDGGKLRYRAPKEAVSEPLLLRLKEAKGDIVRALAETPEAFDVAPLSYGQRALWFVWALAPESSAYNLTLPLRVGGNNSDAELWRAAARALLARHQSLRTTFLVRDGEPFQQVHPAGEPDWKRIETGDVDAAIRAAHAEPFDLARGPLARFRWIEKENAEPLLLITLHHIIADGWSYAILRDEIRKLVDGIPLAPLPMTFAAAVRQQRAMLKSEDGARLRDFWQEQLAAPLPRLELPTDRPRPAVQTYNGDAVSVGLPDLATSLTALAHAQQTTPFTAYLAVFLTLLHRLTGERDLVIGVPTAGRARAELMPLVGYFVDPVVVRARAEESATFREFLAEVRRVSLQAIEHRDYPFALLVETLRVERDASRSPIFDVTFNYLGNVDAGLAVQQAEGKFDLTLTVMDGVATFGYNTDLFDRATIEHIAAMFVRVLEAVIADPDARVDELPLTDGGFAPALRGRKMPAPPPFIRMFEAQVRRVPQQIAVVAFDATLTYAELNFLAGEKARELREGSIVPIAVPRSAELLIQLLAAHKAGAAYLPIDPATPPELAQRMREIAAGAGENGENGDGDGSGLAYVIFTSGSTGEPKGVAVTQQALANYVASIIRDLGFEEGRRFALVSTAAADLGHTMLFPALATGGTLYVIDETTATDPRLLATALAEVDYVKIVPSHLAAVAPAFPRRAVILGGERSSPEWLRTMREAAPNVEFFNHYGPTETTVGVLSGRDGALTTAVANTDIYLLDAGRRPVPPGVVGELYVAGAALARGYLGDEARTNERFVTVEGIRLYRTGDLARQTRAAPSDDLARQTRAAPSGAAGFSPPSPSSPPAIEILGRADRQLKLRGYRVEPAQIEAALLRQPTVRQCAVLPNADGAAATHLIAYVVGEADEAALARELPPHMMPSLFVTVESMPLTKNGKLDTAALRRMKSQAPPAGSRRYVAPRDEVELRLHRLWTELLDTNVERRASARRANNISIHDDFFQLGGHSLLAVRLAARIEDEFGERIPLATFLRARTIEQLAAVLRSSDREPSLIVPLQPKGEQPPLFCFPGAGGSVLYFADVARTFGGARPLLAVQAIGFADRAAPPRDVETIATRSLEAIREVQPRGPYRLAGHSFGALVAYEIARLLLAAGEEAKVIVVDQGAPQTTPQPESRDWLAHIALRIRKLYGVPLRDARDVDDFVAAMREAGLLPPGATNDSVRRYVELYEANVVAAHAYDPLQEPLDVDVTVIRAEVDDAELHNDWATDQQDLGWSGYARRVAVRRSPGTHITMLTATNAAALAAILSEEAQ